MDNYIDDGFYY